MFEHFTESARRSVFWARLEAGRLGSEAIEPEQLLLGFLMEDQGDSEQQITREQGDEPVRSIPILARDGPPFFSAELAAKLRQALADAAHPGKPKPDAVDMPVSEPCQRALIAAAEQHTEGSKTRLLHILWALTSDHETSVGNRLKAHGVTVAQVEHALRSQGNS